MKLSTRSRYGTKLMVDLAQHYAEGPIPINDIAKRQEVSVKYLEQLIIPLKKAKFVKSVRGPKGGHMLAKPIEEITVGDIVRLLESKVGIVPCFEDSKACRYSGRCLTEGIWVEALHGFYGVLDTFTLSEVIKGLGKKTFIQPGC